MSMIGKFAALPLDTFAALRTNPTALEEYLYPDSGDYPDDLHPECDFLCVGKAWHGMHFLLTGTAWSTEPPLGIAVLGGKECGKDTGYGPLRYLEVNEVREVASALADFSIEQAAVTFAPADLDDAEIYPSNWEEEPGLSWVVEWLGYLVAFYRDAASQGKVVIKYID